MIQGTWIIHESKLPEAPLRGALRMWQSHARAHEHEIATLRSR